MGEFKLDVNAYLSRIGAEKPEALTVEALRTLTRAHLETVAFENLMITEEGKCPSLKAEDLYEKVVAHRRGGYCFELNKIFYLLLQSLGFSCYPVAVRVIMGRPEPCPYSHRGTVVELEGKKWYVDVGFGGLGPKGIIDMECSDIQTIVGESFRVSWEDDNCVITYIGPGPEKRMLSFRDFAWLECDFEFWSAFFGGGPHSPFGRQRIAYICTKNGWLSLVGRKLARFADGETTEEELPDEESVRRAIREEFLLEIPAWETKGS